MVLSVNPVPVVDGNSQAISAQFKIIETSNDAKVKSSHHFSICDAASLVPTVRKENIKVGLVVIDPPFGVLTEEEWDEVWDDDTWNKVFNSTRSASSPVLVFVAEQQLSLLLNLGLTKFQNSRIISWLKLDYWVAQSGRHSRPVNL